MKKLKYPHWSHILTVIFLGIIFYDAATIVIYKDKDLILKARNAGNIKDIIDAEYRNAFSFRGPRLVNKGFYVNFNGLIANILGKRLVNNVVKLNNGYLDGIIQKEDFSMYVGSVKKLKSFLDEKGIYYLYVQAPYKICKYDPQLPVGIENYSNENADNFLNLLENIGIDILDLREELYKDSLNHYSAFYKTDLHWKHETALWAASKILRYLDTENIIFLKDDYYIVPENYIIESYKNIFLGNYGKRTGRFFGGLDDINVLLPKDTINNPLTGIDESKYLNRDSLFVEYYISDAYNFLYPINGFENKQAPVSKRILLIADSFANSMQFFMTLNVGELKYINLTLNAENIFDFIEGYNPDIVIMLFTTNMIGLHLDRMINTFPRGRG
jgi:hypothetical protein